MAQVKNNNSNNLRQTREGFRPARSDQEVQSDMEKGWPPAWSVSFADLTTNLMCFFVLWYALTIMKLPAALLAIKTQKQEINIDTEETREILKAYEMLQKEGLIAEGEQGRAEKAAQKLEEVVEATQKSKEVLVGLKGFLDKNGLSEKVELGAKGNEIILTPRDSLFFDKGRAAIKEDNLMLLKQVAFILKSNPALVRIEGYTDDTPILPYNRYRYSDNWQLSSARAVSVARYLIEKEGIEPQRVMVSGYGPLKPVAPNSDPASRAKNRRVEIHMVISEAGQELPAGKEEALNGEKA